MATDMANDSPSTAQTSKRRIYLLTHPRTASNLLIKIFNFPSQNVPARFQAGYFFRPPVHYGVNQKTFHKPLTSWTPEHIATVKQKYQDSFEEFKEWIDNGEKEGKIIFVKEHVCFLTDPVAQTQFHFSKDMELSERWQVQSTSTGGPIEKETDTTSQPSPNNKTVLPDSFLFTFHPTFLIRHPALVFPSYYRAHMDTYGHPTTKAEELALIAELEPWMTFHWQRTLYEFYSSGPSKPTILDADDVILSPAVVMKHAELIGLEKENLQWDWEPLGLEELSKIPEGRGRRFVSTISRSAGVEKGKVGEGLDLEVEAGKWMEEFGELVGGRMEVWVKGALSDYEFLRERRLRS